MPDKLRAKDLSYDSTLPPFLQRLRAQNAGSGDQDRHERPIARNKGKKRDDEDDGPTVVDESGETLSKEEYAMLTKDESVAGEVGDEAKKALDEKSEGGGGKEEVRRVEQKLTDGAALKKRKVAKVVGDENEDLVEDKKEESKTLDEKKPFKKAKKKSKPIKLAFDDGEEG